MSKDGTYYVVRKKALPEVLLGVVEAKRLLARNPRMNIQQAADQAGISRSSFYKYQDDIFPFHENTQGQTITFVIQMMDEPGVLSNVLQQVADNRANILTIHQSIPVNGVALLTLSVAGLADTGDISQMLEAIEQLEGIHYLKILARE